MPEFVKDVEKIRQRAARKIEEGAVTESYKGDVDRTIAILNEALATEIVCVLRYLHHYFMATGVHGTSVADEFKEHADAEREHADMIAERIQQLGGKPDFNPKSLVQRSVSQYIEGETLADMIKEDLIAERMVIEVYQEMVRYFANNDPTTRHMVEEILADEEEHASDLADLLYIVDPASGKTEGQDPGTHPLRMHGGEHGEDEEEEFTEERRPMSRETNAGERQTAAAGGGRNRQSGNGSQQNSRGKNSGTREPEEVLSELGRERNASGAQSSRASGRTAGQTGGNRVNLSERNIGWRGGNGGGNDRGAEGRQNATSQDRSGRDVPRRGEGKVRDEARGEGPSIERGAVGTKLTGSPMASSEPAHTPGTVGRPMNRRAQSEQREIEPEVAEREAKGAQSGGTRSVAVTNKRNKKRVA